MENLTLNEFGRVLFQGQTSFQPKLIDIYDLVVEGYEDLSKNYTNISDKELAAEVMPIIFSITDEIAMLDTWSLVKNVVIAFGNNFRNLQSNLIDALIMLLDKEGDEIRTILVKGILSGLLFHVDKNNFFVVGKGTNIKLWKLMRRLCTIGLPDIRLATAIKDDSEFINLLKEQIRVIFSDQKCQSNQDAAKNLRQNLAVFKSTIKLNLVGKVFATELFYAIVTNLNEEEKINLLLNI